MIIYFSNIFVAPLAILIWLIDTFVIVMALRIILCHIPMMRNSNFFRALQGITDPAANAVRSLLFRLHMYFAPSWLPWLCLGIGCFLVRNLLAAMLVGLSG